MGAMKIKCSVISYQSSVGICEASAGICVLCDARCSLFVDGHTLAVFATVRIAYSVFRPLVTQYVLRNTSRANLAARHVHRYRRAAARGACNESINPSIALRKVHLSMETVSDGLASIASFPTSRREGHKRNTHTMSNPLTAGAAAVVRDFYQKAYNHDAHTHAFCRYPHLRQLQFQRQSGRHSFQG